MRGHFESGQDLRQAEVQADFISADQTRHDVRTRMSVGASGIMKAYFVSTACCIALGGHRHAYVNPNA